MKHRRIRIVLEYEGTNYSGWQVQNDRPTVQEKVEDAIEMITGGRFRVTAAGRTDAGVHARGQTAHFDTEARLSDREWIGALNAHLPEDIRVLDAREAGLDFDARRSATGKLYRYRVLTRRVAPAIDRERVWHVPVHIDEDSMREATRYLVGEHDFTSFKAAGCASKNPVRVLKNIDIKRDGDLLVFDLVATAFLRYMVRNIVGTLIEVGRGKLTPSDVKRILDAKDRTEAGPTAPSQGLTLVEVYYSESEFR